MSSEEEKRLLYPQPHEAVAAFEDIPKGHFSDFGNCYKGPSKSKFHTGLASKKDKFVESVPSQWCQLQAIVTANTESLTPAWIRFKASPHKVLQGGHKWYKYSASKVISHTDHVEGKRRVIHRHVYLENLAITTRQRLFWLAVKLMKDVRLEEEGDGTYSWRMSADPEYLKYDFVDDVTEEIPGPVLDAYGSGDLAEMLIDLIGPFLANANYNSIGSQAGCSVFNMAQILTNLETRVKLRRGAGKIDAPWAVTLQGGNEEEGDNVFFEYAADSDNQMYEADKFKATNTGRFLANLLDGKQARPTKSARPDFVLKYRGCPLAYGEAKSHYFSTGLSYTTICSSNILNFLPLSQPAVVLYSTSERFIVQAVSIDEYDEAIKVLQRNCSVYHLEPPKEDDLNCNRYHLPPLMYKFVKLKPTTSLIRRLNPIWDPIRVIVETAAFESQRQKQYAEKQYMRRTPIHPETPASAPRSYNFGSIMAVRNKKKKDHDLVMVSMEDHKPFLRDWVPLPNKVKMFLLSAFEAIDVVVATLIQQDFHMAARSYKQALVDRRFVKPTRIENPQINAPRGRNDEIVESNYQYSFLIKWNTLESPKVLTPWRLALVKTRLEVDEDEERKRRGDPDPYALQSTPLPPAMQEYVSPVPITPEIVKEYTEQIKLGQEERRDHANLARLVELLVQRLRDKVERGEVTAPPKKPVGGGYSAEYDEVDEFHHQLLSHLAIEAYAEKAFDQAEAEAFPMTPGVGMLPDDFEVDATTPHWKVQRFAREAALRKSKEKRWSPEKRGGLRHYLHKWLKPQQLDFDEKKEEMEKPQVKQEREEEGQGEGAVAVEAFAHGYQQGMGKRDKRTFKRRVQDTWCLSPQQEQEGRQRTGLPLGDPPAYDPLDEQMKGLTLEERKVVLLQMEVQHEETDEPLDPQKVLQQYAAEPFQQPPQQPLARGAHHAVHARDDAALYPLAHSIRQHRQGYAPPVPPPLAGTLPPPVPPPTATQQPLVPPLTRYAPPVVPPLPRTQAPRVPPPTGSADDDDGNGDYSSEDVAAFMQYYQEPED